MSEDPKPYGRDTTEKEILSDQLQSAKSAVMSNIFISSMECTRLLALIRKGKVPNFKFEPTK